MGWKTFFTLTEEDARRMYYDQKYWGELYPIMISLAPGVVRYGVGRLYDAVPVFKLSPKISHPLGAKSEIHVKLMFLVGADAPAGAGSTIGIVFYKDGETCKDPAGYDFHGASFTLKSPSTGWFVEYHTFKVVQENNVIKWYVDDTELGSARLEGPLASFALAVRADQYTGIAIYEVIAKYYDMWEDIMGQLLNAMMIAMFIMMGVMIVTMIVRAFRR